MKTTRYKNNLARARQRRGLQQKQVARMLGHHSTHYVSRYELGRAIPSFEVAVLLSLIYQVPLGVLFVAYFEKCRRILERRSRGVRTDGMGIAAEVFCTIEDELKEKQVTAIQLDQARSHVARLIRDRAERMGHPSS